MQVASVTTERPNLRATLDGWSFEDSNLLVKRSLPSDARKLFIGFTPAPRDIPDYSCILEMLAEGWELLGPPQQQFDDDGAPTEEWMWWLQRQSVSSTAPP